MLSWIDPPRFLSIMHFHNVSWRAVFLRCMTALLLVLAPACSPTVKMDGDPLPPQVIVADLLVAQLDLLDTAVAQGESIPIAVAISGSGLSVRDVACNIYISTSPLVSASSTLAASLRVPAGSFLNYYSWSTSIATSALQLAPGTYYAACVVDPQNQIVETDEGNNLARTVSGCQVTTVGAPDLADGGAQYWSINPSTITQPGAAVSVGFRVLNGTATPSGAFLVRVYASIDATISVGSDILVHEASLVGMSPYEIRDLQRPISTGGLSIGQSYYIGWLIDAAGSVVEASESNNFAVITPTRLTLGSAALPDLAVSVGGASFSPGSVAAGGPVSASCPVSNLGTAASGSYSVSFYASLDTAISVGDVLLGSVGMPSLLPGSAVNCSLASGSTSSLQPGVSYWIGWVIDPAASVPESNEANNSGYVSGVQLVVSGSISSAYFVASIPNGFTPQLGAIIFDGGLGPYDDWFSTMNGLPFPIRFYGQSYSSLQVHTNGFITFGTTTLTSLQVRENTFLPASGLPNNLVALFWDDLVVGSGAEINYAITGTAPNRALVIEFLGLQDFSSSSASLSGQIRLYEAVGAANSRIELVYGANGGWGGDVQCTIGIENSAGTSGLSPVAGSPFINTRPSVGFRFQ